MTLQYARLLTSQEIREETEKLNVKYEGNFLYFMRSLPSLNNLKGKKNIPSIVRRIPCIARE